MVPLGISANALAMALRVLSTRISEIVAERRSISADTAYRLARYFGMPAQFWMNLQSSYELAVAYKHSKDVIKKEVLPRDVSGGLEVEMRGYSPLRRAIKPRG